ncbi:MAG TPA: hypothetical protein VG759_07905 [Candidatus Angelobacter sp.]|jgi:hypothetical protein|nr:hypothetical protein [Candidatus Angelobacter sp.]
MKRTSTSANASKFRPETPAARKPSPARSHSLLAKVTPQEEQAILEYCQSRNLSVSRFLAQVALDDARSKKKVRAQSLTITIKLPSHQCPKLLYMAQLREKSIHLLVEDFTAPKLDKTRGPGSRYTLQSETLRSYLNSSEYALLKRHMENQQAPSRHYLAQLALQAIQRHSRRAAKH